tara:strand:+ start:265 stop:492 length:228 start_codon:yes stop_codon:yes gene_type:complete
LGIAQEHEAGEEEEQETALEHSKRPPMSVFIARHKRLRILPQCFSELGRAGETQGELQRAGEIWGELGTSLVSPV